ncbi:DUF4190 domain-containing protein [Mycolicibacterium sp. XJ1819]
MTTPQQPDPYRPVDYPGDAGLPPPIYPGPAPGYPGAPYGGAYDPYWPVRPPGVNGKATASLVLSVIGVTCCGLTSIVGLILGVVAMRETRRTGQDGYGLAVAGTVLGGLAVAGWLVYVLLYVAILASGWQWI